MPKNTAHDLEQTIREEALRRVPPTKPEMLRVGYIGEVRFLRYLHEKPWFTRLSTSAKTELEGEVGRLVVDLVSEMTVAGIDPLRAGLEATVRDLFRLGGTDASP